MIRIVEVIDNGLAAAQVAHCFNGDEAAVCLCGDGRVKGYGHGDRIGQVKTGQAGRGECKLFDRLLEINAEVGQGSAGGAQFGGILRAQRGMGARDVPSDHFDRHARLEDDFRRFGIGPKIVFGDGGDVAVPAPGAAHDDAFADSMRDSWILAQGDGDVGQGAKCDEVQFAGELVDCVDDDADGIVRGG